MRAALLGTAALAAAFAGAGSVSAQDATWLASPGSGDFSTSANWTPATVPTGIAIFGGSSITTLTFSGSRNLDAFQFNAGAPAYTFNLTSGFGLRFHTDGIVNNSSNAPAFNVSNSPLIFDDSSTAGNAIINLTAGTVQFLINGTAGTAQLNAAAAGTSFDFTATSGPGGLNVVTAGSISGAGNFDLGSNQLLVGSNNLSTAVSGVISGNALVKEGTGTLTLSGANTYTGGTTISAGTIVAAHQTGGVIDALGPGNITLDGGTLRTTVSGSFTQSITFNDNKTSILSAGAQSVSLDGTVLLGPNATAQFGLAGDTGTFILNSSPSADTTNKVIVAGGTLKDGGDTLSGLTFFASTAVNAGATLDFNDSSNQAIRNLTGAGSVVTGTVGGTFLTLFADQNTTSTFAGVISGPGQVGVQTYAAGTNGTMIFTGVNTYTGGTFVCACATLQLGTLTAAGSIIKDVTVDGTFNVVNSDTSGITSITIDGGTAQFFNGTSASAAVIVNKNNGTLNFFNTSTAGTADITNRNGGLTTFADNSTAGNATITNRVTGGETDFLNTSNAGHAIIVNNGGLTGFLDQSSAANADITNRNGGVTVFGSFGGSDTATAGNATITNRETGGETIFQVLTTAGSATIVNNGGVTSFFDNSNAGTATITNRNGGATFFSDTTSAANATIVNRDGFFFLPSITIFSGTSDAGTATITSQNFGLVQFVDDARAANAVIVNNNNGLAVFGTPFGSDAPSAGNATITNNAGGSTTFNAFSTAGSAVITTNSGAATFFYDNADGGLARFITNAGGTVDFSQTSGPASNGKITAGSLAGAGDYYLGGNQLTVGGNNLSTEVSGIIHDGLSPLICGCAQPSSGASLVKVGTGTLTLSGVNTYTGPTTINAGILAVNGSIIASSGVTVNAGGTLGGNGIVPTTTINGGTLAPGNSIGLITVSGGLSFVGAGNYLVEVSPTSADRTNVTGAATLSGTVQAVFQSGAYGPKSYVILSANGGRSGTFGTLATAGLPAALSASITYTPTDVVLNLSSAFTQLTGLNVNQTAVATALDKAFNGGAPVNPSFGALFGLPASALPGALTQLSGEIGTGAPAAAFQTIDQFLAVMLDPFLETRFGDGTVQGRALSFAPESSVQAALPAELLGYNSIVTKAPPMVHPDRRWTVWGAAYGGSGRFNGDSVIGSGRLTVSTGSFAAGIDYRVSPDTVLGVAVAGGAYNYGIDALGSGRGDLVQGGLYGSTRFAGNAYVSAALAFGRHDLSTDRTVAFGGVMDRLSANFSANSFGGRIESGYRFALMNGLGLTPFAALQTQRFDTPAYAERDLSGLGLAGFALNYAGRATTDTRSELGTRVDYRMMTDYGALLTLRARAAWGHEFSTERSVDAVFQALPGFGFRVIGAAQAADVALVSAGAELKFRNGVSLSARFDGELSGRTQVYAGAGALRFNW